MTRHTKGKANSTRRDILESADRLFRHQGVDTVSISTIMDDIGLTVGGFYSHFSSKEDLASEVCSHSFYKAIAAWRAAVDGAQISDQCQMEHLLRRYFELAAQGSCPVVALGHEARDKSRTSGFIDNYRSGTLALLEILVSAGLTAGITREQSLVIFSSMLGIGFLSNAHRTNAVSHGAQDALLEQLRSMRSATTKH